MKLCIYIMSLFFLFVPFCSNTQKDMVPFTYLLFLQNIGMHSSSPSYRSDDAGQDEVKSTYGEEFLVMFQDSLQDGFFGGVKWGIAACFYQVLYELSSGFVSIIPDSIHFLKRSCIHVFDMLCGRPASIDVHALSILVQLFHDTMQEYNALVVPNGDQQTITFHTMIVKQVCEYLLSYLCLHKKHYVFGEGELACMAHLADMTSPHSIDDVAFVITILEQHVACVLECIQTPSRYAEVPHVTRATLHAFQTLGLMLRKKGPDSSREGVFGAWFSKRESKKGNAL